LAAAEIGVNVGRLGRFGRLRKFHRLTEAQLVVVSAGASPIGKTSPPDPTNQ
jgi:hypothetical protein